MIDRRNDLLALVLAQAQAHDANFLGDQRLREAVFRSVSPARRKSVMGDPIRYVQLMHVDQDRDPISEAYLDPSDRATDPEDVFELEVWYEYADNAVLASSSQAGFDALMFATTGTLGLVPYLSQTKYLSSDEAGEILEPEIDVLDVVQVDNEGRVFAHYALLTIRIA